MVRVGRLELPTSRLSVVCSSQLSYTRKKDPRVPFTTKKRRDITESHMCEIVFVLFYEYYTLKGGDPAAGSPTATLLRLHPNH